MITGKYSGKQPAITALTAIFSIEHGAHLGGIGPMISCGSRLVPASIRSTRSGVGGTIGKPSLSFWLQNQSLTASQLSSTSMRGEVRFMYENSDDCSDTESRRLLPFPRPLPSPLRGRTEVGGALQ